jgi:hypothetical protein
VGDVASYTFMGWSDGSSETTKTIVLNLDNDAECVAVFDLTTNVAQLILSYAPGTIPAGIAPTFTVSYGGYVFECSAGTVNVPRNVQITITAGDVFKYDFVEWTGGVSGATKTINLTITNEVSVIGIANYESTDVLIKYKITTSAGSNGTISPGPGVTEIYEGTPVTVAFIPNYGYAIDQVLVNGVPNADAKSKGYLFIPSLDNDYNVQVSFTSQPTPPTPPVTDTYVISAIYDSSQTILSPNGVINADSGSSRTFTFSARPGYKITHVLIDNVNNDDALRNGYFEFVNIKANHTIVIMSALEEESKFVVNVDINAEEGYVEYSVNGGSFKRYTGPFTVNEGDAVSFREHTFEGYVFDHWSGTVNSRSEQITISDINRDVYLEANINKEEVVPWLYVGIGLLLLIIAVLLILLALFARNSRRRDYDT